MAERLIEIARTEAQENPRAGDSYAVTERKRYRLRARTPDSGDYWDDVFSTRFAALHAARAWVLEGCTDIEVTELIAFSYDAEADFE